MSWSSAGCEPNPHSQAAALFLPPFLTLAGTDQALCCLLFIPQGATARQRFCTAYCLRLFCGVATAMVAL